MWIFRPFSQSICAFTLPGSFFTGSAEAGLLPGLDPVRLRGITEHFHTPVNLRLICKADDLFGVLLEDIDFGTDIDFSVLPADAQDAFAWL